MFLAGGITGCPDWQRQAAAALADRCVVLNPRRADYPAGDPQVAEEQVAWEHTHLRQATITLFWFPAQQVQPIALYELGTAAAQPARRLVVGAHPDYPRRHDLILQLSLARPDLTVHHTLDATIDAVRRALG